jgi:hypothetical protein
MGRSGELVFWVESFIVCFSPPPSLGLSYFITYYPLPAPLVLYCLRLCFPSFSSLKCLRRCESQIITTREEHCHTVHEQVFGATSLTTTAFHCVLHCHDTGYIFPRRPL